MSGMPIPKPGRRRRPATFITKDGRVICRTYNAWDIRRRLVWVRAGKRCERCGRGLADLHDVRVHHLVPRRMGGGFRDDKLDNLQCLCWQCHLGAHGAQRRTA